MAKKHKKKIYTTPKKEKHVHKNSKLNILKVFNKNPKCSECNNFMAVHRDRFTCSKCNKSIQNNYQMELH